MNLIMGISELPKDKKIILFDGVCNLCEASVQFVIKYDKKDVFRFVSFQSELGDKIITHIGVDRSKTDSIIVYEPRIAYYTKAETDSLFINTSCGGINATGRALLDATSVTSLRYGNRTLNDNAGNSALTWADGVQFTGTKLGFYNTAVTIQPASTNVVSALVNLNRGVLIGGSMLIFKYM